MVKSVLEYLENSAARFPDKKAVADDKSSMTYSELVNNARNIAAGLLPYTEGDNPVHEARSGIAVS